ncbi:MAG TPA: MaoC family dehydratase [Acidimicrobiia bacterium]|nr:MaoC family dehydratase [Acidimicrobiia bacterium]
MERRVTMTVTPELVRAYSRRGNFHSDAREATALGMPGLVAQGVQVAGPAYHVLLEAWGEEFLAHGRLDLRFVGMVVAGDTIDASVKIDDGGTATIEVVNTTAGTTSVVGSSVRG